MKIAEFEKVSLKQYMSDMNNFTKEDVERIYNNIKLPIRKTRYSAGHDFHMPYSIEVHPREQIMIPTGVKCNMSNKYVMLIFPRSSFGIKRHMAIANTIPVIDSDYINADNEGHIFICIQNNGKEILSITEGEAFAQAVFVEYGVADNGDISEERTGGIGSTGK